MLNSIPRLGEFVFIGMGAFGKPLGEGATEQFLKGIHVIKLSMDGQGWVDKNVLNKKGQPSRITPHGTARAGEGATEQFLKGIHVIKLSMDGQGWVDKNVLNKKGQPSRITPHGTARATFRTWAEESHKHEKASELCLLHLPKDIYGLNKKGQPSRITPHGTARATFRTWAEESHKHEKASELCLLHLPKDIYGGAYKRGLFEKERREIMQEWGDFCISLSDLEAFLKRD